MSNAELRVSIKGFRMQAVPPSDLPVGAQLAWLFACFRSESVHAQIVSNLSKHVVGGSLVEHRQFSRPSGTGLLACLGLYRQPVKGRLYNPADLTRPRIAPRPRTAGSTVSYIRSVLV
jgi:hypothetical protein